MNDTTTAFPFWHHKEQVPWFAMNSAMYWIYSLKIVASQDNSGEILSNTHSVPEGEDLNEVFQYLYFALQNLYSLKLLKNHIKEAAFISPISITAWYYGLHHSANALLKIYNKKVIGTHANTNDQFVQLIEDNKNLSDFMFPFSFRIKDTTENHLEDSIAALFNELKVNKEGFSSYNPICKPRNEKEMYYSILNYLKGTWKDCVKKRKPTVDLRKKENQGEKRKFLAFQQDMKVGFLNEAYRLRTKAQYRDSVFFTYNNDSGPTEKFIENLYYVLRAFLQKVIYCCQNHIDSNNWKKFLDDLESGTPEYHQVIQEMKS